MIEGTTFYLRNAGPRTVRVVVVGGGRHLDPTQKGIIEPKYCTGTENIKSDKVAIFLGELK